MKKLISILTILFLILQSCEDNSNKMSSLCSDFQINFSKGSGWTGWKYDATFRYPDSLIINEHEYTPTFIERKSKYLITQTDLDSILSDLQKISDIKLKDYKGFIPLIPTDIPTYSFKYLNFNYSDSSIICSPDVNEVPYEFNILPNESSKDHNEI